MKNKRYVLIITSIILIANLLVVTPVSSDSKIITTYTAHDPIHINGDEDFANQASNESWPGNGSKENPYVIEGYDIIVGSSHGISIKNTRAYFIIRNCKIHDGEIKSSYGIFFCHVTNGKITNCNIYDNRCDGIVMVHSHNNTITNCNIYDNRRHGIVMESWYSGGIHAGACSNNIITNCNIYGNGWSGIDIFGWGEDCSNNSITNCNIHNNRDGISMCGAPHTKIHHNNIFNNRDFGLINMFAACKFGYCSLAIVDARYNYWGDASGPFKYSHLRGRGDIAIFAVIVRPWLTSPCDNPFDNLLPSVEIVKPKKGYLYSGDRELLKLRRLGERAIIIGSSTINITVNANDSDGNIAKVEFYINGQLEHTTTTPPYYYHWKNESYWNGYATTMVLIKVKAYDDKGVANRDVIDVLMINPSGRKK